MKRFLVLFWLIASVGIAKARSFPLSKWHRTENETTVDSVFFSVKSLCNFSVEFTSDRKIKAIINGKTYVGSASSNKFTKGFFDFTQNGSIVFTFTTEPGKLLIVNQQYQFGCESAKIVELSKLTSDAKARKDFDEYADFNSDLWQNTTAVNDKAYYLGELKLYETAIYVLEKVVSKNPERAVAWLNLGDYLWETKNSENAKKAYSTYVSLIEQQKKSATKIPKRVHQRLNSTP
ncbi:hypothetical protein [Flavobacterium sp.]|uniref:tetratricopeptide repeat protein n=1 Tax=Flavobacterium sp. TaxID=239 RepID=UPI00122318C9|nr:hypothetical protein [Flavobacterium sp.]RZJ70728.1 MAG: hypothetical protein EOO49_12815 [Flavobacterium sp.]